MGEEILLTYTSPAGTARLTVFLSDFGALVELDQKTYKPNDKVFLTVIAPDLNLDPKINDEIGHAPESLLQIKTGIDEITEFKLRETGSDTGIFTGEFQLKSNNQDEDKTDSNSTKILSCTKDDFIEVIFSMFDEQFIGKALIKS